MSDRHTGFGLALPTQQKRWSQSLNYLVSEMSRFVIYCGHSEIGFRCDGEPHTCTFGSSKEISNCLECCCACNSEPTPVGDHQANGAAEAMVRVLRAKANLLVQQIEESTGCPGPTFGCLRQVYCWSLIHAAWLHGYTITLWFETP